MDNPAVINLIDRKIWRIGQVNRSQVARFDQLIQADEQWISGKRRK